MAAALTGSDMCSTLASLLPGKVSLPSQPLYDSSINSYFFGEEKDISPTCIVSPASASDVATVITSLAGIPSAVAAIRGGGATPFAGAANINNGVTIDLRGMNTITVSSNRTDVSAAGASISETLLQVIQSMNDSNSPIVSVGGGATWGDVYDELTPLNLVAVGGRGMSLGVGGLIIGGGISFSSPQRGFACDNVLNMEVVLPDGTFASANSHENSDLFEALKGGSNNFGIVTRFDLQTFSQSDSWNGHISYPPATIPQQLSAFGEFMVAEVADPHADIVCSIGYVGASQVTVVSNVIFYSKPEANPAIFQPFTGIQPQLSSTMRIANTTDFVSEVESHEAKGARAIYLNTVFRPTSEIILQIYDLWNSTIKSIKAIEGVAYYISFQRLPAILPGNSLGLSVSDSPLVLCLLSVTWANSADDDTINSVTSTAVHEIETATKASGLFNQFKYLNYAAAFQDPIASYGVASQMALQAVSRKYDPQGFFQTGVPGGFKLFGNNTADTMTSVDISSNRGHD